MPSKTLVHMRRALWAPLAVFASFLFVVSSAAADLLETADLRIAVSDRNGQLDLRDADASTQKTQQVTKRAKFFQGRDRDGSRHTSSSKLYPILSNMKHF